MLRIEGGKRLGMQVTRRVLYNTIKILRDNIIAKDYIKHNSIEILVDRDWALLLCLTTIPDDVIDAG